MSAANTDVESLARAQRELADFRSETERFWRAANYAFDILEDELAQCRAELARQAEEAGVRTASDAASGNASEISRMLYENEYGDNAPLSSLRRRSSVCACSSCITRIRAMRFLETCARCCRTGRVQIRYSMVCPLW